MKETDQLELLNIQVPKGWLERLQVRLSDLQDIADDADNAADEAKLYARDAEDAANEASYAANRAQEKTYDLHQEVDGILNDINDLLRPEEDDDDR